jgi:hypothetical protein
VTDDFGADISTLTIHVEVQSGNISLAVYRSTSGSPPAPGLQLATTGAIACPGLGNQAVPLTTILGGGSTVRVRKGDWIAMSWDNATCKFVGDSTVSNVAPGSALFNGLACYQSAHPCPATPSSLTNGMLNLVGISGN